MGVSNLIYPQSLTTTSTTSIPEIQFLVHRVVDGDTARVWVNGESESIRIIGLDTPETVDPRKPVQCFGQEASDKAKSLLEGQIIGLEIDTTQGEQDKYQRLIPLLLGNIFVELTIQYFYLIVHS